VSGTFNANTCVFENSIVIGSTIKTESEGIIFAGGAAVLVDPQGFFNTRSCIFKNNEAAYVRACISCVLHYFAFASLFSRRHRRMAAHCM
jgi:hypothetical protein